MGQALTSPSFRSLTHLNAPMTGDDKLGEFTRWRINLSRKASMGLTPTLRGHWAAWPSLICASSMICYNMAYNQFGHSRLIADEFAVTIDHRHGYENFESMSAADQARVKAYIRGEAKFGGYGRCSQLHSHTHTHTQKPARGGPFLPGGPCCHALEQGAVLKRTACLRGRTGGHSVWRRVSPFLVRLRVPFPSLFSGKATNKSLVCFSGELCHKRVGVWCGVRKGFLSYPVVGKAGEKRTQLHVVLYA